MIVDHATSHDTIVAPATPAGIGALAIIRLSGPRAITLTNSLFYGKDLTQQAGNTVHFGTIGQGDQLLDEVLVTLFRAPYSFTKEDAVEITCHGSPYIVQQLLQRCYQAGARLAAQGEFTQRAFLQGRFDLTQAEAVADLIAAESEWSHQVALRQMRGGFSHKIKALRVQLLELLALVELELDFSEEDVKFADRTQLGKLTTALADEVAMLLKSFAAGNVIKKGVPVALVGAPNAGKSTLLNALLQDDRAIVSNIPGTTRDTVEAAWVWQGIQFRLIDTAGLRTTANPVEALGIARTQAAIEQAAWVLYICDLTTMTVKQVHQALAQITHEQVILLGNKIDQLSSKSLAYWQKVLPKLVPISAETGAGLAVLKDQLTTQTGLTPGLLQAPLVTNVRHREQLQQAATALATMQQNLAQGLSNELLAQDLRTASHHLGAITGQVYTDEVLGTIFSSFCIGK